MAKKRQKTQKTNRYVPRQTRKFQLRLNHPTDMYVAEVLDEARKQRREVTIIREGVMLWWALENGNLEYLFEKFPQYRSQLNPDADSVIQEFLRILQSGAGDTTMPRTLPSRPELPRLLEPLPPAEYDDQSSENFLNAFL